MTGNDLNQDDGFKDTLLLGLTIFGLIFAAGCIGYLVLSQGYIVSVVALGAMFAYPYVKNIMNKKKLE